MTNDLDLALREAADDLHLDVPLTDVMSRGTRIRRRRQRVRIGVAGTALAVTAGVATIVLPPGSSPLPAAEAGWGPAAVNLSESDLTAAQAECAATLTAEGHDVTADAEPWAADTRGGTTFLVYRHGDSVDMCALFESLDGFTTTEPLDPMPEGHHVEFLQAVRGLPKGVPAENDADQPSGPPEHETARVMRVSDEVARVVVTAGGEEVEARVADGLAVSWLPRNVSVEIAPDAIATAYAADGTELDRVSYNSWDKGPDQPAADEPEGDESAG